MFDISTWSLNRTAAQSTRRIGGLTLLICALLSPSFAFAKDAEFEALLDRHWQAQLRHYPTFATSLGVRDYDSELADPSLEAFDARTVESAAFLNKLKQIKRSSLSTAHQLNYDLLALDLQNGIEEARHGDQYRVMTNRNGLRKH